MYLEPPEQFSPTMEVVSCFIEHGGAILFLLRCDHKPQGGTWAVPAGKVEHGETLHEAMIRELSEEIAWEVKSDDLRYFRKVYIRFPEFDFVYHLFHLPVTARPEITLNVNDHQAWKWMTPKESLQEHLISDEDACIKLCYNV